MVQTIAALVAVVAVVATAVVIAMRLQKEYLCEEFEEKEKSLKDDFNKKCEKTSEVITNAVKEKSKIRSGDSSLDFSSSLDILQKHSETGNRRNKSCPDKDRVSKPL